MPRRTNAFQRLVYLIQHQLADGASVTESKLLPDTRSGRLVEVDIVVEGKMGDVSLVIGMECTSEKRPATVEWVNEMAGKHADLPVNKTLLVSKSGFTAEALTKAASRGMEALPLVEAETRDWASWVYNLDALKFAGFALITEQVSVAVLDQASGAQPENPLDSIVEGTGVTTPCSLGDYVQAIAHNERVLLPATRGWMKLDPRPPSMKFEVIYDCPPGTTLRPPSSEPVGLIRVGLALRLDVQDMPFLAKVSRFRDHNIVHGEVADVPTNDGTRNVLLTLFEKGGTLEKGAALLTKPGSSETQVVTVKFALPEETNVQPRAQCTP